MTNGVGESIVSLGRLGAGYGAGAAGLDGTRRRLQLSTGRTSPVWISRLPNISGIEAIIAIRGEFNDARIVVLTT